MAKPEWGVKRICPSCGARYYDMRKDPPICPTCGTQFDPEALLKSRRARPVPADDTKKSVVPVRGDDVDVDGDLGETGVDLDDGTDGAEVLEDEVGDDGVDDDVLMEDTSELGEDDMDEVVDVETEGDDDDR